MRITRDGNWTGKNGSPRTHARTPRWMAEEKQNKQGIWACVCALCLMLLFGLFHASETALLFCAPLTPTFSWGCYCCGPAVFCVCVLSRVATADGEEEEEEEE
jgi:hypothetical protein